MKLKDKYERIYENAVWMLMTSPELEFKSAFKQAGHAGGIPYGRTMGVFVRWCMKQVDTDKRLF